MIRICKAGAPPAYSRRHPPVLPFIRAWSQEEFITAMRTGVAPGGYVITPTMPTKQIGMFDDIELAAMYGICAA